MKARILLIEDDASTAAALGKVLRSEGYEVEFAAGATKAWPMPGRRITTWS